jgi:hypothetical protein
MIILIFTGCKNRQRDDKIAYACNFTVPEMLSFELDSPITLADNFFNADVSDTSKMVPLSREAMKHLLKIEEKVYNEVHKDIDGYRFYYDSVYYNKSNIRFFIYGKLDLQPEVKSIVLWKFERNDFHLDDYLEIKSFWLLNIKKEKLCSVTRFGIVYDGIITTIDVHSEGTMLKDGIFTVKRTNDRLPFWTDFWVDFRADPAGFFKERITGVDEYYTYYSVDKDGFIEFVED